MKTLEIGHCIGKTGANKYYVGGGRKLCSLIWPTKQQLLHGAVMSHISKPKQVRQWAVIFYKLFAQTLCLLLISKPRARPPFDDMAKQTKQSVLILLLLNVLAPTSAASTNESTDATCPLDLSYVPTIEWNHTLCEPAMSNLTSCCQTLLAVFSISLAKRLRNTGLFRLPDSATSASCLAGYRLELSSSPFSPLSNLISICFTPDQFVITPDYCDGIKSTQDWIERLGNSTALNSACYSNLDETATCLSCLNAGFEVSSNLTKIDGNNSHSTTCFYLTVLYVAGIINMQGPLYPPTFTCLLGLEVSEPTLNSNSNSKSNSNSNSNQTSILASSISAAILLLIFVALTSFFLIKRSRKRKLKETEEEDIIIEKLQGSPMRFYFTQLKEATSNYSSKLGEGGFGSVFAGTIGGEKVAVKCLDSVNQGQREFLAEIHTIGSIHHINLVRLIGFCAEKGHKLLVYEYMTNGSLDKWIFNRSQDDSLDWKKRVKIITDVAKGLSYLHEECRQRIAHLDIKPQNILLDDNFDAKLSDFGLAKIIDRDQSHVVTRMKGTRGYLAPEWLSSIITEKVDVYSFGVVIIEIVCGRKNLDYSQPEENTYLISLLQNKIRDDRVIEIIDENIVNLELNVEEIMKMVRLAIWCLETESWRRPRMSVVVKVLEGSIDLDMEKESHFLNAPPVLLREEFANNLTSELSEELISGPR
ncbi:hypothetical protein LUZ60_016777 [Juncus effusus]|nr:hypothetical protein LUZ60_016777 [Juncus effusus]